MMQAPHAAGAGRGRLAGSACEGGGSAAVALADRQDGRAGAVAERQGGRAGAVAGGFAARDLGQRPLPTVWEEMKRFTAGRTEDTRDEVWFVEHPAIFTLGLNGNAAHILNAGDIPVLKVDRGGQVTYHGPGQLVAYTLLDLVRLKLGIRGLVEALERAVVDTVAEYGVQARGRRDAPGVYVDGCKLAALGLKISRRCSYHGIALNVDMDLEPFSRINPCGFEALPVTDLRSLCGIDDVGRVRDDLERNLRIQLERS